MTRFLRAVAGCVVASLCLSVVAAEKAKRRAPIDYSHVPREVVSDELRKDLLQFMLLRQRLLTPPQTCAYQTGGVCVIQVPVILLPDPKDTTGMTQYCVALFPAEFHLPGSASTNTEKTIVWSLLPPSPAPTGPATFTFYDEPNHGIIILSDDNKQIHAGTLGDGTMPVDATKYLVRDKHKGKNEAVYLPIVVRTDNPGTTSKKVSVCGTPDPKVVSD